MAVSFPSKVKSQVGKAVTTVKTPEGAEQVTEEVISKDLFDEPPVQVGVSFGFTMNMGNYSSARADVTLTIPCKMEDIEDVYEFSKKWIDAKLDDIQGKLKQN